jgi:hypothetical protein
VVGILSADDIGRGAKLMKRLMLITMVFALVGFANSAEENSAGLKLEWRPNPEKVPSTCSLSADKVVAKFKRGDFPLVTEVAPATSRGEDSGDGLYATPVGTYVAAFELLSIDGRLVSLFVNCANGDVYASARGGFNDAKTWYGPFKGK